MERIDDVLGILQECAVLDSVSAPRAPPRVEYDPKQDLCGVVHMATLDDDVHHIGVLDTVARGNTEMWGERMSPRMCLIEPNTPHSRAWAFAHTTLGVLTAQHGLDFMMARMRELDACSEHVVDILMGYVQDTQLASELMRTWRLPPAHRALLRVTTNQWVTPELVKYHNLHVAGKAVAHMIMSRGVEAEWVDVWVDDILTMGLVLKHWRREFIPLGVGVRADGVVMVTRPGATCVVRVRVSTEHTGLTCQLQPALAQVSWDGAIVRASPRAERVFRQTTGSPWHPSCAEEHPTPLPPDASTEDCAWHMCAQLGCHSFSTTPEHDNAMLDWVSIVPAGVHMPRYMTLDDPGDTRCWARVDRMYVLGRTHGAIHVLREPEESNPQQGVLHALVDHLARLYPGTYVHGDSVLVHVSGPIVRASTGEQLTHVPVGTSVGGVVYWEPQLTVSSNPFRPTRQLMFVMSSPRVYPTHIPRQRITLGQ